MFDQNDPRYAENMENMTAIIDARVQAANTANAAALKAQKEQFEALLKQEREAFESRLQQEKEAADLRLHQQKEASEKHLKHAEDTAAAREQLLTSKLEEVTAKSKTDDPASPGSGIIEVKGAHLKGIMSEFRAVVKEDRQELICHLSKQNTDNIKIIKEDEKEEHKKARNQEVDKPQKFSEPIALLPTTLFLQQFLVYMEEKYHITDKNDMITYFQKYLDGEAKNWFTGYRNNTKKEDQTWDHMSTALKSYFMAKDNAIKNTALRKQKVGESVNEYACYLNGLSTSFGTTESVILQTFTSGLREGIAPCNSKEITSMKEAVALAQQQESDLQRIEKYLMPKINPSGTSQKAASTTQDEDVNLMSDAHIRLQESKPPSRDPSGRYRGNNYDPNYRSRRRGRGGNNNNNRGGHHNNSKNNNNRSSSNNRGRDQERSHDNSSRRDRTPSANRSNNYRSSSNNRSYNNKDSHRDQGSKDDYQPNTRGYQGNGSDQASNSDHGSYSQQDVEDAIRNAMAALRTKKQNQEN